jgi:hypothetical protein
VSLGGVRTDDALGAGSLIFMSIASLRVTFLALEVRAGVAAAFRLLAHVFEDPASGPFDESPTESAVRARAEIGTAGMGDPP